MRKILFGIIAVLALSACSSNIVYSRFSPLKSNEWHMDSAVCFDYQIENAKASYTMILYVRHTEHYPYQNMWLFIDNAGKTDTIEFYLADDRGQWLGDQHHGFIEMPVLLEEAKQFADTGVYRLSVQHGMRDEILQGVSDIGIEISRNEE